jgi:hypothetical protein
MSRFVAQAPRL